MAAVFSFFIGVCFNKDLTLAQAQTPPPHVHQRRGDFAARFKLTCYAHDRAVCSTSIVFKLAGANMKSQASQIFFLSCSFHGC